jgi:hypothetical protein
MGLLALTTLASALAQTPPSDCSAAFRRIDRRAAALAGIADSSCLNAKEQGQLAERFVNERLSVWSKRLNLEGWKISVIMTRRDDLKTRTLGGIRWDKAGRHGVDDRSRAGPPGTGVATKERSKPQQRGACSQWNRRCTFKP